jgi:hypothetical protein
MINCRDGVLPRQRLLWNERAKITDDRAHVAVGQFEPRSGKCVGKLIVECIGQSRDQSRDQSRYRKFLPLTGSG